MKEKTEVKKAWMVVMEVMPATSSKPSSEAAGGFDADTGDVRNQRCQGR